MRFLYWYCDPSELHGHFVDKVEPSITRTPDEGATIESRTRSCEILGPPYDWVVGKTEKISDRRGVGKGPEEGEGRRGPRSAS